MVSKQKGNALPTAGETLEEWAGQDVMVEMFTGAVDFQIVTRLDGVNDWGIILKPAEPGGGAVFYPWYLIVAMQLAREEDLDTPANLPDPPSSTR